MHISEKIQLPYFSKNMEEVTKLLEKAEVKITFWGSRVVTVDGLDGRVSLSSLVKRSCLLVDILKKSETGLTPEIRALGIKLDQKLYHLFDDSYSILDESNFITRLIVFIREYIFGVPNHLSSGYRSITEDVLLADFLEYDSKEFVQTYCDGNMTVEELEENGDYLRTALAFNTHGAGSVNTTFSATTEQFFNRYPQLA